MANKQHIQLLVGLFGFFVCLSACVCVQKVKNILGPYFRNYSLFYWFYYSISGLVSVGFSQKTLASVFLPSFGFYVKYG